MCGAPILTPRLLCLFLTEHNIISFKMCPNGDTAGEGVETMSVTLSPAGVKAELLVDGCAGREK